MVSLGRAAVEAALTSKLGFVRADGDHYVYKLEIDGQYVARTKFSGSHKQLSDDLVAAVARQIGLTSPQLRQMVSCTIDRSGYLQILEQAESNPTTRYGRR